MLVEVVLGSGLKAIHAVSQENLIAVHGKNLLFGEVALNLQRQNHLLNLAAEMALRRKKQIARELHGKRGSALRARPRGDIAIRGPQHAPEIDSPMLLKTLVFRGQDGITQ